MKLLLFCIFDFIDGLEGVRCEGLEPPNALLSTIATKFPEPPADLASQPTNCCTFRYAKQEFLGIFVETYRNLSDFQEDAWLSSTAKSARPRFK